MRVVAGSADTWRRQAQVGLLVLGPNAWISHESASWLHRFDRALDDRFHFTVLRSHRGAAVRGATPCTPPNASTGSTS